MSLLLDVLNGKPTERYPVWLMRQAGRYMPSYQQLRKKQSLHTLFHNSDIATEVTLLPIKELGVDASILFSDILVILETLGLSVVYPDGSSPYIENRIETPADIAALTSLDPREVLPFVSETIKNVVSATSVPLIGFAGGPFTVASYAIEPKGKHSELFFTRQMMYHNPEAFEELIDRITEQTIAYLQMQIEAGAEVCQLFDSWAGLLPLDLYNKYSLEPLRRIIEAIAPTPLIYFSRGSCLYRNEIAAISPAAISYDWQVPLATLCRETPDSIAVQGNFDPLLLTMKPQEMERVVIDTLSNLNTHSLIVNLGHGLMPHIPYENVVHFVKAAQSVSPLLPLR